MFKNCLNVNYNKQKMSINVASVEKVIRYMGSQYKLVDCTDFNPVFANNFDLNDRVHFFNGKVCADRRKLNKLSDLEFNRLKFQCEKFMDKHFSKNLDPESWDRIFTGRLLNKCYDLTKYDRMCPVCNGYTLIAYMIYNMKINGERQAYFSLNECIMLGKIISWMSYGCSSIDFRFKDNKRLYDAMDRCFIGEVLRTVFKTYVGYSVRMVMEIREYRHEHERDYVAFSVFDRAQLYYGSQENDMELDLEDLIESLNG